MDKVKNQHGSGYRPGARFRVLLGQPHHWLGCSLRFQVLAQSQRRKEATAVGVVQPSSGCLGSEVLLGSELCLSQVGHDGLLHVSLSCLVYIGLHPADRRSGTHILMLLI